MPENFLTTPPAILSSNERHPEPFRLPVKRRKIMRNVFLAIILTLIFGGAMTVNAQKTQQVTLRLNKQAKISRSNLTIRFLSVEDSRCPRDVQCVWAGNAAVTVKVTNGRGASKTFELNTNLETKSASFDGYEITLGTVTPYPRSNIRIDRNGYTATLTVSQTR
jgi:hypothetical protein